MLWVEILNRALEWGELEAVQLWLRTAADDTEFESRQHGALVESVSTLRAVYLSGYLQQPMRALEAERLSQWLVAVTISARAPSHLAGFDLPILHAMRVPAPLPRPLETLVSSALLQLLAAGTPLTGTVERCHGLRREPAASLMCFAAEDEARCAARAGLGAFLERDGLRQCARLVAAPRRGRYCSKECGNAAFAARKAAEDPRYFAAKQDRYRQRRDRARRPRAAAFVYMD